MGMPVFYRTIEIFTSVIDWYKIKTDNKGAAPDQKRCAFLAGELECYE